MARADHPTKPNLGPRDSWHRFRWRGPQRHLYNNNSCCVLKDRDHLQPFKIQPQDNMSSYGAGGFIPFSPPPSSIASSDSPQGLPRPRSSPLRAGGSKESSFIRHVDQQILHIQRRFAKRRDTTDGHVKEVDEEGRMIEEIGDNTSKSRLASSEEWHDVSGYGSFAEAARDVENLMAVIWVSGTRTASRYSCVDNTQMLSRCSIPSNTISHLPGTAHQYHDSFFPRLSPSLVPSHRQA